MLNTAHKQYTIKESICKAKISVISDGDLFAIIRRKSIASSFVLASCLALLLPFQAGADIMLTLADFLLDAGLLHAALETLESILQGLLFLDLDFRH